MGLFDKWKKNVTAPPPPAKSEPGAPQQTGHSDAYRELLAHSIGTARLRQQRLRDFLAGREWSLDLTKGVIQFGELEFATAFLGSESDIQGTWMWGSYNINGFAQEMIADVCALVGNLPIAAIPDLAGNTLPLDELVNGHYIASIATALHGNACYYRCPYDGGAAFVLVKGLADDIFVPAAPERIITLLGELCSSGHLPHRPLAEGLLGASCAACEKGERQLAGMFEDGSRLEIAFDGLGRIANISSQIKPEA